MGYVKDEPTGKFRWVDEPGDEGDEWRPMDSVEGAVVKSASAVGVAWATWLIGVVIAGLLGTWGAFAVRNKSESISQIRSRPASYDGRTVLIRGRVGEVFDVGGSCAYYLRQGRDTIVVFTRGGRPLPEQSVTVRGSISMGYLDGVPRPALFESGSK